MSESGRGVRVDVNKELNKCENAKTRKRCGGSCRAGGPVGDGWSSGGERGIEVIVKMHEQIGGRGCPGPFGGGRVNMN